MNTSIPDDWPSVDVDRFLSVLEAFDYKRYAWSNAIQYTEKRTGRTIGFEVGDASQHGYLLNRDLVVDE